MYFSIPSKYGKLFSSLCRLKKGKNRVARESLDLDITLTLPPVSQSSNSIDRIMHNTIEIAKVVHREWRFSDSL